MKEGIPEDEELEYLSKKVHYWKTLGRRLMFDEAELQEFDHKDHEKISEKAYAMLLAWKQRKGLDATYSVLNQALRNKLVNRADLAQKFCCQVV